MKRALCATRPVEWWETADEGARLALMLCSVCPELAGCDSGDLAPHGVIRAGVAWSDAGERLPLCPCGYPAGNAVRSECFRCVPRKDTPLPAPALSGGAERHASLIRDLLEQGWTYRAIGVRIGSNAEAVRGVARRHGWASRLAGRPQASSTGDAA